MQRKRRLFSIPMAIAALFGGASILSMNACSTAPKTESERAVLTERVHVTISQFKSADPSMAGRFDSAYGYAVFPSVGKGAVGVGGAYGRGQVFEQGQMVGYTDLSQATIGVQLGGQAYSEVIFFQHRDALDRLRSNSLEFAAQASAVAATAGASSNHDYTDGVLVFTMAEGGLMFEASIGGQKFTYIPASAFND